MRRSDYEHERRHLTEAEREGWIERLGYWAVIGLAAVICLVLTAPLYAATLSDAQRYTDAYGQRMGIAAVVITADLPAKGQRGESRAHLTVGKKVVYSVVLDRLFLRISRQQDWQNTVRHELCHLRTYRDRGEVLQGGKFHGRDWVRCAYEHDVDLSNMHWD